MEQWEVEIMMQRLKTLGSVNIRFVQESVYRRRPFLDEGRRLFITPKQMVQVMCGLPPFDPHVWEYIVTAED